MALTEIKTSGIADDAVTTDKLANAINTERTANTAKPSFANDANNRVVTGDGSGGLNGEANLTFDGSLLTTKGSGEIVRVESTQASGNCYLSFQDSSARKGYIGYGAGNDPFYIVQDEDADIIVYSNGANRVQFKPDGDVNIVDGDLVIGTSGHGIDFSATSDAAGMTSELLDSYEEGTYTATLTCLTSGTITVNSSNDQLYYTKIGRVVYVTGRISVSAVSSPNGVQLRLNLPIVSAAGTEESGRVIGWVQVQGAAKDVQDYTSQPTAGGNTYIQIGFSDNTIFTGDICGDINTSTKIAVNFHYVT